MRIAVLRAELRGNTRLRAAALLGVMLGVGVLFSVLNLSLVRAANAAIVIPLSNVPVPQTDPFSPVWDQATAADIPLSAQQMYQPGGGSVQAVQVKALHDDKHVAFLVSWADATRNDYVKDLPSDAAAIQLPIDPVHVPYQCMGQSNSLVNIWQWKAALEQTARQTGEPFNGTRNLTSDGMGKAADADGVRPTATSTWKDGRWYVIYVRNLADAGTGTAPLVPGVATNAAFAVWDGSKGETRSMKAVSTWIPVTVDEQKPPEVLNYLTMAVVILAGAAIVALAWRLIPH
jgi:DMSO reductase family type II enzyme heme b subunit